MDKAEYSHYHGHQDIMDELEEKFQEMRMEIFEELLKNHDEVAEAIGELAYDADFVENIIALMKTKDHLAMGNLLNVELEKFLYDKAEEITTDRT